MRALRATLPGGDRDEPGRRGGGALRVDAGDGDVDRQKRRPARGGPRDHGTRIVSARLDPVDVPAKFFAGHRDAFFHVFLQERP